MLQLACSGRTTGCGNPMVFRRLSALLKGFRTRLRPRHAPAELTESDPAAATAEKLITVRPNPAQVLADLIAQHRKLQADLKTAREKLRTFHAAPPDVLARIDALGRSARMQYGLLLEERVSRLTTQLLAFQRSTLAVAAEFRSRLDEVESKQRGASLDALSDAAQPVNLEQIERELKAYSEELSRTKGEVSATLNSAEEAKDADAEATSEREVSASIERELSALRAAPERAHQAAQEETAAIERELGALRASTKSSKGHKRRSRKPRKQRE